MRPNEMIPRAAIRVLTAGILVRRAHGHCDIPRFREWMVDGLRAPLRAGADARPELSEDGTRSGVLAPALLDLGAIDADDALVVRVQILDGALDGSLVERTISIRRNGRIPL